MPLSVDAHNFMLDNLAGAAGSVALLTATSLTASASGGSSTVSLNRAVAAGDTISLNNVGAAQRHVARVTSGGENPTIEPAVPGDESYNSGDAVGHAPLVKADADALRPSGTGTVEPSWADASNETVSVDSAPGFTVEGGNSIGGFALYSGDETVFYGSFLTTSIESFGAAGSYELTQADVNLDQRLPN